MSYFFSGVSKWIIGEFPNSDTEENDEIIPFSDNLILTELTTTNSTTTCVDSTNDEIVSNSKTSLDSRTASNRDDESDFQILDDAAEVAINLAKNVTGGIFNIGKYATKQLYSSAVQLKNVVENSVVINDLLFEQEQFLNEVGQKNKSNLKNVVPPWTGYMEEAVMKTLILGICKDKNNFLRGPLPGEAFNFDYDLNYPTAMLMLQEDIMLERIRFELVPKQVQEKIFWRNYFYKIHLIKQSAQLSTLAKMADLKSSQMLNEAEMNQSQIEQQLASALNDTDDYPSHLSNDLEQDYNNRLFDHGSAQDQDRRRNGSKDFYQLADWEQELINELGNDPQVLGDGGVIPEELEKELLSELDAHLKATGATN